MPPNQQLPQGAAPPAPRAQPQAQGKAAAKTRQVNDVETKWPMFTLRKRLDPSGSVWIEIDNVQGLKDPQQWTKILQEVARLEDVIWDEGFRGWIVAVPHGNDRLERWIPVIGGKPYHKDAKFNWYHKYILSDPDGKAQRTVPMSAEEAVKAYQSRQQPVLPGEETR